MCTTVTAGGAAKSTHVLPNDAYIHTLVESCLNHLAYGGQQVKST
jgi:hypothetical protein